MMITRANIIYYSLLIFLSITSFMACGYVAIPNPPQMFAPSSLQMLEAQYNDSKLVISWNKPTKNRLYQDFETAEVANPYFYEIYVADLSEIASNNYEPIKFSSFKLIKSIKAENLIDFEQAMGSNEGATSNKGGRRGQANKGKDGAKVGTIIENPIKGRRLAYVVTTRDSVSGAIGQTDSYLSVYIVDSTQNRSSQDQIASWVDIKLAPLGEIYKNPTNFAS